MIKRYKLKGENSHGLIEVQLFRSLREAYKRAENLRFVELRDIVENKPLPYPPTQNIVDKKGVQPK